MEKKRKEIKRPGASGEEIIEPPSALSNIRFYFKHPGGINKADLEEVLKAPESEDVETAAAFGFRFPSIFRNMDPELITKEVVDRLLRLKDHKDASVREIFETIYPKILKTLKEKKPELVPREFEKKI